MWDPLRDPPSHIRNVLYCIHTHTSKALKLIVLSAELHNYYEQISVGQHVGHYCPGVINGDNGL